MIYFFHHYELPVIVQQAQLQQIFMRSVRNNNNQAAAGAPTAPGATNQQNRENQQQAGAPSAAASDAAPEQPVNNANNMFLIRGTYRRRVNHLVERLRNNFYSNVFGVGMMADNNNNNNPGLNNLTRSLRLLNLLFPNRPILNVRIINVRSASASATVADILRTADGGEVGRSGQNNEGEVQGNTQVDGQSSSGAGESNLGATQENEGAGTSQIVPEKVGHKNLKAGPEFPTAVRLNPQELEEVSPVETSSLLDTHPSPPNSSFTSSAANGVPESSTKHQASPDEKKSENVMQTTITASDGGTSTSSSNEQC